MLVKTIHENRYLINRRPARHNPLIFQLTDMTGFAQNDSVC